MLKTRIAVLVSGGGTNLQALIDAQKSGIIKSGKICMVISNKENAYALTRARENGIKALYIKKDTDFEKNLTDALEKEHIDIIVLAGFLVILSDSFVKKYPNRIINIHPSLIPSFCGDGFYGLRVHEAALKRGVRLTGATTHFVNEITDGGDIIMQRAVEVRENDTPEILQKRVMEEAEWKILPLTVEKVSQDFAERKDRTNDK